MTVQKVTFRTLNGRLGVRSPSGVECHAYVGPCSSGALNTPSRHVRQDDVVANYDDGPTVELAINAIERWKADVLMVRANATTNGSYGSIDVTNVTGTCNVSIDATTHPNNDYGLRVDIVTGGTVGTAGITYQTSSDDGNTKSAVTALGTADFIVVPNTGGAKFLLNPSPTDETALNTLINEIKTDLNAHVILTTGTVHSGADNADVVSTATATNTATRVALVNALRAAYEAHRVKGSGASVHINASGDTTNAITAPVATDDESALVLALDLKAKLNAHDAGTTWHTIADATNTVTSAAPSPGTLNAGDYFTIPANAPVMNTTDLSNALAPLKSTLNPWTAVWIATPIDAAAAAVLSAFLDSMESVTGQARKAYATVRMPNAGETESQYLTAQQTEFNSFADFRITCCAGAARVVSARTGRPFNFRRPAIFAIAGLPAALPLGVDMSQTVDATPEGLPGVSLYDANGNNVEHDEMLNPGLSDARFLTLRTWPDTGGIVYVNDPVTLETPGGDFHLDQFVRILCQFCNTARRTLKDELSRELALNLKDNGPNKAGAPTEAECQRIDARVKEALNIDLAGQVSGVQFAMHRDDKILTTQTLNADGGVIFNGYPKLINFTFAAINPAAAA